MNIKKIILSLYLFYSINLFAQKVSIDGFVYDAQTGEKISDANIYIQDLGVGTTTNEYGYYTLFVPANKEWQIMAGFAGYQNQQKEITTGKNMHLDFELVPDNTLETVTLEVKKQKNFAGKSLSALKIPVAEIKKIPVVGGEPDLMKAFQLMPGVSSGKEGSSDLFVRGGSPDQNLILLDDVPLYYVNHLGGFASVFNIDAIQNVDLIKGGFPARYGNRLSSVVDVRMKEGNRLEKKTSYSIGLLNAKIMREGPINKKMSYMVSARRFYYDLLTAPIYYIGTDKTTTFGYFFYDINAKINYEINKKHHLYFSVYSGDDKFYLTFFPDKSENIYSGHENRKSKYSKKWGNQLAALRWHYVVNNRTDMVSVLSYSKYRMYLGSKVKSTDDKLDYQNYFSSKIQDVSFKNDIGVHISNSYKILAGGAVSYHFFDPATQVYKLQNEGVTDINKVTQSYNENALEYNFFIENQLHAGKKFFVNAGFRYNHLFLPKKSFPSFEPRINFSFNINETIRITGGYSRMQQNLHLLSTTGIGMPVDLWLPATTLAPPEKSEQFVLGISKDLPHRKIHLNLEAYYKTIEHLIAYKPGKSFSNFSNRWEDIVVSDGTGTSYGLELFLQKKSGKHTGWFSYTWSKTDRKFACLNKGEAFPFNYDRRHDISIVYNYNFKKNIQFSAVWQYGTGYPFTMEVSKYLAISNPSPWFNAPADEFQNPFVYDFAYNYSAINALRMHDFHRLDIGVNFIKQKKKGTRTWNLSIVNVYNRQNPYFYYIGSDEISPDNYKTVVKQLTLFPFFPSFSYSRNF